MANHDAAAEAYRTDQIGEVWYSIHPSVLPPDDSGAPWVDLHRHHEDGTVVLGRFAGFPAAIAWAWERFTVDPAAWQRSDDD